MNSYIDRCVFRSLAVRAFALFCLGLLFTVVPMTLAYPQVGSGNPSKEKRPLLVPGTPIESALVGKETDSYEIQAGQGQFVHAVVNQRGVHVALTLYSPNHKTTASTENPNGTTGVQQISSIATANGTYILTISSSNKNAPLGHYSVSIDPLRFPTEADRSRISAERQFDSAGDLYAEGDSVSRGRAAQKYQSALQLWHSAGDIYEEAVTLNRLGMIFLFDFGAREKALNYFNQALPLRRAAGDHAGEAATLINIGQVYIDNGETSKALDQFQSVLAFERDTQEQTLQPSTFCYLGEIYLKLGQVDEAQSAIELAVRHAEQLGDLNAQASSLSNLGKVHDDLGEKKQALEYYHQALSLERALEDTDAEATTLNNIGGVYDDLGLRRESLNYYEQALKFAIKLPGRTEEAATRNNIGLVFDELAQSRTALIFYDRALSLWRWVGDRDGEANTLTNIGFAYHHLGRNKTALGYYKQALPILQAVSDRSAEAMTLHNIGVAYDRLGRAQEALDYQSRGLLLFSETHDLLDEGLALSDLMLHSRDAQNYTLAIFYGKEAVNTYQQIRRNIGGLDRNLQKRFVSSKGATYRELADLLITQGRLDEAEQVLGLLKQQEYFDFVSRDGKGASSVIAPVTFINDESELNDKYVKNVTEITTIGNDWTELHAKAIRTPAEEKRMAELHDQLEQAVQEWQEFLSDLAVELKSTKEPRETANDLNEKVSGMISELRQLDPGTVALYTLVGDEKYSIILVTSTVRLAREYPIRAAELRRKVLAFREALQNPTTNPKPLAQELYQILVGPVASELIGAQAKTLMWSLDDVLRYLPTSALHDGHDYLVAKYRNEVFTPASIARLMDRPDIRNWSGLGMGVSKAYGNFPPLPSVRDELRRIIRDRDAEGAEGVLPGETMLDDAFTEDNMKKALEKKYPLVHIASHFNFEPGGNAVDSFLLLGGTNPEGQHLTLAEIRKNPDYDFNDTDLLTLSACDTAMGDTAGNGSEVDGLGMLMQQNGAKAVVATLWAVNDMSTGLLMQKFYHLWTEAGAMPKGEALRQAQVALLRGSIVTSPTSGQRGIAFDDKSSTPVVMREARYSHPYYWRPLF